MFHGWQLYDAPTAVVPLCRHARKGEVGHILGGAIFFVASLLNCNSTWNTLDSRYSSPLCKLLFLGVQALEVSGAGNSIGGIESRFEQLGGQIDTSRTCTGRRKGDIHMYRVNGFTSDQWAGEEKVELHLKRRIRPKLEFRL